MCRTFLSIPLLGAIALMAGLSGPATAQETLLGDPDAVMRNQDSSLASQALVSRLPSGYLDDDRKASTMEIGALDEHEAGGNILVLGALGLLFAVGLTIIGLCFLSWRSGAKQPVKVMAYH